MTAFNVVRFRVKPGEEQRFIDAHRKIKANFKGLMAGSLVKTGDQTFCFIGEWKNFPSIAAARPQMIAILDGFRGALEDLGGGLGLTDPVSGEVIVKLPVMKSGGSTKRTKSVRATPAKAAKSAKPTVPVRAKKKARRR